jgi:hypothetical protein
MEQDPLHLLIKKEHSCLFTFLWNVKRQLCPYFITKWREIERIQIPTGYHLSNLLAYIWTFPLTKRTQELKHSTRKTKFGHSYVISIRAEYSFFFFINFFFNSSPSPRQILINLSIESWPHWTQRDTLSSTYLGTLIGWRFGVILQCLFHDQKRKKGQKQNEDAKVNREQSLPFCIFFFFFCYGISIEESRQGQSWTKSRV